MTAAASTASTSPRPRQSFGIPALDEALGGGLLPGTLTVIAGATGGGKSQLGVRWAARGRDDDDRAGVFLDLSTRGDSQNHLDYARSLADWEVTEEDAQTPVIPAEVWDRAREYGHLFRPFPNSGRKVTRRDLDPEAWHDWKADIGRILRKSVEYLYASFTRGTRRVVVDGIEPTERSAESMQFEYFEYLYQNAIRRDDSWVARELFREGYRANEARVAAHAYDAKSIGCVFLYTTPQIYLDNLLTTGLGEGDLLSNANTVIYLGRTKQEGRLGRALAVVKHRGSACSDAIHPYRITDAGLVFD